MFRISARTCRTFTFGEILIMAALNVGTHPPRNCQMLSRALEAKAVATLSRWV